MSTITSKHSKAIALAGIQALVAGMQKHFPNGSFMFGNVTYTTASFVQAIQALEDALTAVNAAQATARDAVRARRAAQANVAPLMRDLRTFLRATFSSAATLADFGLTPIRAPRPLDSEQRATATAKLRATRLARGTKSKKQKLAIKGDVTGVVVTPVTLAGPSSPTAAPAGPALVATATSGTSK